MAVESGGGSSPTAPAASAAAGASSSSKSDPSASSTRPPESRRVAASSSSDFRTSYNFPPEAFLHDGLPDIDTDFTPRADLDAFAQALAVPDPLHSPNSGGGGGGVHTGGQPSGAASAWGGARSPALTKRDSVGPFESAPASSATLLGAGPPPGMADEAEAVAGAAAAAGGGDLFISAKNDWAPVHERIPKRKPSTSGGGGGATPARQRSHRSSQHRRRRRAAAPAQGQRTRDETREGYLYTLLKWPFLMFVVAWIVGLGAAYLLTRFYVFVYENAVTWRGRRETLRRNMRRAGSYADWVKGARELDAFLGNAAWREVDGYAYYDSDTVRRVWEQISRCRAKAEAAELLKGADGEGSAKNLELAADGAKATEELRQLIEACVKNNFVGVENPRLYSQTYYGTKNLVQNFIDEVHKSIEFLLRTDQLDFSVKRNLFKRLHANYGRTALCLSGGAAFAYYHFGVVRALLDADLLPDVIAGTSGGALVAALVGTRTNDELKQLLVPGLAYRLTASSEGMTTWVPRWWRTGARFDSLDWAERCSWWTRGSMTFREAFERTGRILNVTCVPADPHSPTILCNYLTSPDCVVWSAVLASAAVPGILNPVVLMAKVKLPPGMPDPTGRGYRLVPYSFGHKWKDGSLRTDIPVKDLNLHFNVNFTVVSQVNPHINLFFFSSRGSPGHPVTHRRGRGWRGGYLGSAAEQYLKLDLTKWLKVLRHLELLPRPLGQDWSQLWLQPFSGTVTLWPKSVPSDFVRLLSDPDPRRLARMIHEGRQSAFPKIKILANRLRVERAVERGRRETRPGGARRGSIESIFSEDDLRGLLMRSGGEDDDDYYYNDDDDDGPRRRRRGFAPSSSRMTATSRRIGSGSSAGLDAVLGDSTAIPLASLSTPAATRRRRTVTVGSAGTNTTNENTGTGASTGDASFDDDDDDDESSDAGEESEPLAAVLGLGLSLGGEDDEDLQPRHGREITPAVLLEGEEGDI